jgi:hypothetical protein
MQPNQYSVPAHIPSEQWSRKSDLLTSKGFAGSKFQPVEGIWKFHVMGKKPPWKGMGGHFIDFYHNIWNGSRKLVRIIVGDPVKIDPY